MDYYRPYFIECVGDELGGNFQGGDFTTTWRGEYLPLKDALNLGFNGMHCIVDEINGETIGILH